MLDADAAAPRWVVSPAKLNFTAGILERCKLMSLQKKTIFGRFPKGLGGTGILACGGLEHRLLITQQQHPDLRMSWWDHSVFVCRMITRLVKFRLLVATVFLIFRARFVLRMHYVCLTKTENVSVRTPWLKKSWPNWKRQKTDSSLCCTADIHCSIEFFFPSLKRSIDIFKERHLPDDKFNSIRAYLYLSLFACASLNVY